MDLQFSASPISLPRFGRNAISASFSSAGSNGLSLRTLSVLFFHKCSVTSLRFVLTRLFLFPTCTCAQARDQRSMMPKSRKADGHAVVESHFPTVCISLACDHVIQAMTGPKRRKPSPALAIGFSMCRYCHKLIGSHQFQEIVPISGPFLPFTNSAPCASNPRKCCFHFSIGVHTGT